MAEKSEEAITLEDKITQAKELYGRGSRNYLVKSYSEAADDLSQVCKLYEDIYGQISDELGMPYLIYAKSLIALAQDENKVIDVPEGGQDEDDDDDNDDEEEEEEGEEDAEKISEEGGNKTEEDKTNVKSTNGNHNEIEADVEEAKKKEPATTVVSEEEKMDVAPAPSEKHDPEVVDKTNEESDSVDDDKPKAATSADAEKTEKPEVKSNGSTTAAEPGTSNGNEVNEENEEDDEAAANLQIAWEILELAAKIFERQGEKSLGKLAEVYGELAGISFENSHFEAAIADFKQSLDIHMKLPDDNRRIIAEIHYKIGLAHLMQNSFDDCIRELKKASELIDEEIEEEKQKEDQSDKQKKSISDLEETKQDILAKITEVEETKQQSIEEVRNELSKFISTNPQSSSAGAAGPSSSMNSGDAGGTSSFSAAITNPPKATDISHLIKRKKPETAAADVESSPAKRPAV